MYTNDQKIPHFDTFFVLFLQFLDLTETWAGWGDKNHRKMKIKKRFEKSKKIEIIKYDFKRALKAAAIFVENSLFHR